MNGKTRIKFLIIGDMHNRIQNVRKVLSKTKSEKFDYVLCYGDIVNIPTGENANKNIIESSMPLMYNIFLELEKIAPILWVPGNHDPYIYYSDNFEEISSKSKNLHKKFQKIDENLYIVGLGGSTPILSGGEWSKDFIPFKDIDLSKFKYTGYPYNVKSNDYIESDNLLLKDFNEVLNEGKKVWGNSQLIFLTHIGPLFSFTNCMEEEGDYLYLGSQNIGEIFKNEENCFIDIHGHSHLSEAFITIRPGKYVFNAGAIYNGNFGILEIVKDKEGKWNVFSNSIEYI
jgi:Icc-related predicted phosphoesterase